MLASMLKPSDDQIRRLAQREANPNHAAAFAPISRGPFFAVTALLVVGLVAIPLTLFQVLGRMLGCNQNRPRRLADARSKL